MTKWQPISLDELLADIATSESQLTPELMRLWALLRTPPVKWQLHPWGDKGGGFWIVGVIGRQVLWYNDIEEGFNISHYSSLGFIDEYWCNQDDLHHAIYALQRLLDGHDPHA